MAVVVVTGSAGSSVVEGRGLGVVLVGASVVTSDGFDVLVVGVDPVIVVLLTGTLIWLLGVFKGRSGCCYGNPGVVGSAICVAATAAVGWVILQG